MGLFRKLYAGALYAKQLYDKALFKVTGQIPPDIGGIEQSSANIRVFLVIDSDKPSLKFRNIK